MADWEEIKRLAADLQRAQLSVSAQKLSERNCIEIVQRLIDLKLIDVIHTTDGKEFLTPTELAKEIREELIVHGGRVNLVDLQQVLNVDLSHIESKVNELVKSDRGLTLVLGQLIDRTYLDSLAEEVNDRLQENGMVTIAELAKCYDLPGEFIQQLLHSKLGHAIKGHMDDVDRNIIYTDSFVSRHRARIRGLFSGITRPTPVQTLMGRCGLQSRLFHSILEGLVSSGRLAGSLTGGRQDKAIYVPLVYTKAQNDWIDAFFKQNGYLEYDTVAWLGISDPKAFIKKRFKSDPIEYLGSCCVGQLIRDQVESEVEEALTHNTWTDILPLLPSVCTVSDAHQLVQDLVRNKPSAVVFCDSIVTNDVFISACLKPFEPLISSKAEQAIKANPLLLLEAQHASQHKFDDDASSQYDNRKEQRRKKALGGKSGGGTQGREVKTKSTKKKFGNYSRDKGEEDDSDNETGAGHGGRQPEHIFMTTDEIAAELKQQSALKDCPEQFIDAVAAHLFRPLCRQFAESLKSVFLQTAPGAKGNVTQKKSRSDLVEKISSLWVNARLFEKGLKSFEGELLSQLSRELLKTVCTDLVNAVFTLYSVDAMISTSATDGSEFTAETRQKFISSIVDDKARSILSSLHKSLNDKTVDDFFLRVETMCGSDHLDVGLKKPDKKKERQLVFNHRQSLADELRKQTDAAMVLHIATVLLFQLHTQCMLHAPGRCVPAVIEFLAQYLPAEQLALLVQCQELVMKRMKMSSSEPSESTASSENGDDIHTRLADILPKVKDLALTSKRTAVSATDET